VEMAVGIKIEIGVCCIHVDTELIEKSKWRDAEVKCERYLILGIYIKISATGDKINILRSKEIGQLAAGGLSIIFNIEMEDGKCKIRIRLLVM